jgi:6-phosphogluconolactonase (cycloisomerase 2 family)
MNDLAANDPVPCLNSLIVNSETEDPSSNSCVNRRAFLSGMGIGGAALLLSPLHLPAVFRRDAEELLFFIGTFGEGDAGTLHMLGVDRGKPSVLHSMPSKRPSAIVRHPYLSLVYVANEVSRYQYQPRGTVETFAVNQATGILELVGRQPLSLSAIRPRSLAVSPDGQSLLVAAFGGGAYNVLPIDESGLPGAPSGILKQAGHGEHLTEQACAHPSHVLFCPQAGIAVAADYGADRLDVFTADDDDSGNCGLKVTDRIPCAAGSGPKKIALHGGGEFLAVAHALRPALTVFCLTSENKVVMTKRIPQNYAPTAISFHPEHEVVYAAQSQVRSKTLLSTWSVDRQTGSLRPMGEIALPVGEVTAMHAANSTLWMAAERGLVAVDLDTVTGEPQRTRIAKAIADARTLMAFRES